MTELKQIITKEDIVSLKAGDHVEFWPAIMNCDGGTIVVCRAIVGKSSRTSKLFYFFDPRFEYGDPIYKGRIAVSSLVPDRSGLYTLDFDDRFSTHFLERICKGNENYDRVYKRI